MKQFLERFPKDAMKPEIIGIVVNEQGIERALSTPGVTTLGYPYSISAYFRRANANMTRAESRAVVEHLRKATKDSGHQTVVYISMAFGNPYEEPWGAEIVEDTLIWLKDVGIRTVSLADTVGTATAQQVGDLFEAVKGSVAGIELGVHLHSRPDGAADKVLAAYAAGCRRFDGALTGLGGCPFAGDELVGNIATETVVSGLIAAGADPGLRPQNLANAIQMTQEIRNKYMGEVSVG
jgi:hydroxymethylglutaryl-CoA lyase